MHSQIGNEFGRSLMIPALGGEQQPLSVRVMHDGDVVVPTLEAGLVDAHDTHAAHVVPRACTADIERVAPPQLVVRVAQQHCSLMYRQMAAQRERQGLEHGREARAIACPGHADLGGLAAGIACHAMHLGMQPSLKLEEVQMAPRAAQPVVDALLQRSAMGTGKRLGVAAQFEVGTPCRRVELKSLHFSWWHQPPRAGEQRLHLYAHAPSRVRLSARQPGVRPTSNGSVGFHTKQHRVIKLSLFFRHFLLNTWRRWRLGWTCANGLAVIFLLSNIISPCAASEEVKRCDSVSAERSGSCGTKDWLRSADVAKHTVKSIVWNKNGDAAVVDAVLGVQTEFAGQLVSLYELRKILLKIEKKIRAAGFPAARVTLASDGVEIFFKTGIIVVQVYKGRLDEILIDNRSRIKTEQLVKIVRSRVCRNEIDGTCLITSAGVSESLRLLNELPDVSVTGPSFGMPSNGGDKVPMLLQVEDAHDVFSGTATADNLNSGNGTPWNVEAGLRATNILGMGDEWSVAAGSTGLTQQRGSVRVDVPVSTNGIRAFSVLSQVFQPNTNAFSGEKDSSFATGIRYPIVAMETDPWFLEAQAYGLRAQHTDGSFNTNLGVLRIAVDDAVRSDTRKVSSPVGHSRIEISAGFASLGNSTQEIFGVSSRFAKILIKTSWMYSPEGHRNFYFSLKTKGQLASANLDATEKLDLGGVDSVRAHSGNQWLVDNGIVVNAEMGYRWFFSEKTVSLFYFVDFAKGVIDYKSSKFISYIKNDYGVDYSNAVLLSGAGIGAMVSTSKRSSLGIVFSEKLLRPAPYRWQILESKSKFWLFSTLSF